jgi:hypothetical protein
VTPRQLEILQHALGVDEHGQGKMYRNHFCADGADETTCRQLVALGYMRTWRGADERGQVPGFPYYNCSVTEEGKYAVIRESPPPPKLTRSQRRYREFLKADTGYSFGEWMKAQKGRAMERGPLPGIAFVIGVVAVEAVIAAFNLI